MLSFGTLTINPVSMTLNFLVTISDITLSNTIDTQSANIDRRTPRRRPPPTIPKRPSNILFHLSGDVQI